MAYRRQSNLHATLHLVLGLLYGPLIKESGMLVDVLIVSNVEQAGTR